MSELRFDGRVVIVTGAGRGIGRAYAKLLAARGAAVVVADRDASADGSGDAGGQSAAGTVAEITAAGGRAVACLADVCVEEDACGLVDTAVSTYGQLDAVINNAGIIRTVHFTEVPDEEFQRHIDVHYFGSLRLTRAAWPHLIRSGSGRVVNTVSAAMLGNPLMTHYGSSKGAVFGLTRNLAVEGIRHGIAVNAVAPGAGTRMAEAAAAGLNPDVLHYLRTSLQPEQVAPVGAYLVHPSATVTGEVFNVSGGSVSRLALVTTAGISEAALTVESVAGRFEEIMEITAEATPQVITPAQALAQ